MRRKLFLWAVIFCAVFAISLDALSRSDSILVLANDSRTAGGSTPYFVSQSGISSGYFILDVTLLDGGQTVLLWFEGWDPNSATPKAFGINASSVFSSTGQYIICVGVPACDASSVLEANEFGWPLPKKWRIRWVLADSNDSNWSLTFVPTDQ